MEAILYIFSIFVILSLLGILFAFYCLYRAFDSFRVELFKKLDSPLLFSPNSDIKYPTNIVPLKNRARVLKPITNAESDVKKEKADVPDLAKKSPEEMMQLYKPRNKA